MTWQGAGGTGGSGNPPTDPDDATRTDWSVGSPPPAAPDPQATPDPQTGAPDPAPAQPPMPAPAAPPSAPAALPPMAPAGNPMAPAGNPWAPADPGAGGAWGTPPPSAGGQYSVAGAPGLVYAGAIPRAAAFIVDSFLLSIVVAIVTIPFAVSAVNLDDLSNGALNGAQFMTRTGIASIIGVLIEGAYFAFLWMSTGRATLGMRLFSLQVGDVATGSRLRPDQAVKRWLAYGSWIGAFALAPAIAGLAGLVQFGWTVILLITTVTSPTKQGLHDRFAGSAVVRPASAGNGLALTCLVVALILPIVAVFALISLVFLGGQMSDILSAVGDSI